MKQHKPGVTGLTQGNREADVFTLPCVAELELSMDCIRNIFSGVGEVKVCIRTKCIASVGSERRIEHPKL